MRKIKIGFLPLYVELYDLTCPEMRPKIEAFNQAVIEKLKNYAEVYAAPICRLDREFKDAVSQFEEADVDAIVTMHLDYSPSLESAEALAGTELPIIVLDTTCEYDFGPQQSTEEIMYNHGIHGVQDMCNLLKRNQKTYFVEAGHWEHSDVIERVIKHVRSAAAAKAFQSARVGMAGEPFKGMGDFAVPFSDLKEELGIEVVDYDFKWAAEEIGNITEEEIAKDFEVCRDAFHIKNVTDEVWERSARVNLVLRKWIEKENLTSCTVNFLATEAEPGLPVMPFLEISRQMAAGIGFAGGRRCTDCCIGRCVAVCISRNNIYRNVLPGLEREQYYAQSYGRDQYGAYR